MPPRRGWVTRRGSVEDCATQRNLSAAGRDEARRIGERFRAQGIAAARVYASQWCRCLDTARLLDLGEITPFAGLNSFFRDGGAKPCRRPKCVR
ncbi:histidine phosphatase family protein [Thauera humireducens]|uniref:histidine phosphatase family protein n=1 Tax=Thauera humireducens TaxID=1134435 RepID=UPI00311DF813